jgi:hypothetical protein
MRRIGLAVAIHGPGALRHTDYLVPYNFSFDALEDLGVTVQLQKRWSHEG